MRRRAIEELVAKYAEMLAMRVAHDAGAEGDAVIVGMRMSDLARRFPGALREIDDLELDTIRGRIDRLEGLLRGEGGVEPWMRAMSSFHAVARGALCAKRWLAGRKKVDGATERAYALAVPELAFPDDARAWQGALEEVAAPPRGRLMDLVFRRVAAELDTSEREARRLVFGVPRRQRDLARRGGRGRG